MFRKSRMTTALSLIATLGLAGCGDSGSSSSDSSSTADDSAKKEEAADAPPPKKKMPEYTKSGVLKDVKQWQELKGKVRYARKREEKEAAQKELDDFIKSSSDSWSAKGVPDQEGYYLGILQHAAGNPSDAAKSIGKYLGIAPDDHVNYANATGLQIQALAEAGEFNAAETALAKAKTGALETKPQNQVNAQAAIATFMMKAEKFEGAARHFGEIAFLGNGNPTFAILGADCWQRAGRAGDAVGLARKGVSHFEGNEKGKKRMMQLVDACDLVGKPAPGFANAKWWKGRGGPLSDEALKGNVTVVFSWNMQARWIKWFFKRVSDLNSDYSGRGLQIVGISRLARFDAVNGGTVPDLTDDQELEFYDLWESQYGVSYPLAVGQYGNSALMDDWACNVIPAMVLVGKDGLVKYTRTGKEEEHFDALRTMIDKAYAE
ncbi:MAG: hypothetical protein ACYTG4_00835 [Planctomycetota bacterium]|jgi:tetratricopeptide (TPR) repeat protein